MCFGDVVLYGAMCSLFVSLFLYVCSYVFSSLVRPFGISLVRSFGSMVPCLMYVFSFVRSAFLYLCIWFVVYVCIRFVSYFFLVVCISFVVSFVIHDSRSLVRSFYRCLPIGFFI